ncbi:MAG TPA: glycosyltransferase [Gemmatimonadota bacterium]|jgi:hypothetical protein
MDVLLVKYAYPAYVADFYRRHPGLSGAAYAVQKAAIDEDGFWWGAAWTRALAPLGHRVTEVVMNAGPMQKAWAREHGVPVPRLDWMLTILQAQLREVRPEALFVQSFLGLSLSSLRELRASCPSLRRVVGWCGAAPALRPVFAACDAMLSCVPEIVGTLRAAGHSCTHLHHAFDPVVLERIDLGRPPSIDLSFVGSVVSREVHGERERVLRLLAARTPLQVFTSWGDGPALKFWKGVGGLAAHGVFRALAGVGLERPWLQGLPVVGRAAVWDARPRPRRLRIPRARMRPAVYGLPMFQTLRDSKVTLDVHGNHSGRSASNLRLFEATGMGTCLLTDWKPDLHLLFDPEREVATFRSGEECVEKALWLLEHPDEREAIARAGRVRTLREHRFEDRAPVLAAVLEGATP